MPKPFLLGVEIEEAAFGRLMRKIEAMPGVVRLHLDFRPGKAAKSNGAGKPRAVRGQFEQSGEEALTKAMAGGKAMTIAQMRDLFTKQGRSPASVSSTHYKMRQNGHLISRGRGTWALSSKKAKSAATKKEA